MQRGTSVEAHAGGTDVMHSCISFCYYGIQRVIVIACNVLFYRFCEHSNAGAVETLEC